MRRLKHAAPVAMMLVLLVAALSPAITAQATPRGIVLDRATFSGAIPQGFTGSSDLASCEYRRYSRDGRHHQQIYSDLRDRCDTHTEGAPRKGDVSIYRRYSVSPGEYYKAWAVTRMINPQDAVAQVKLILRDLQEDPPGVAECYSMTPSTTFVAIHTGDRQLGIGNFKDRPPQSSPSGGCKIPRGVDELALHFRVRARELNAHGTAVLDHLRFGRCRDDGRCGNVSEP